MKSFAPSELCVPKQTNFEKEVLASENQIRRIVTFRDPW
jgi:hypothetical protein